MTLKMSPPEQVLRLLRLLDAAGYEAYCVGGCVRDALRGVSPHDYDITTSARPDEIHRVFSGFRTIDTGIAHGTVTVLSDGEPVEVTTYRVDGTYSDARHPDGVTFTANLTDDLIRRDFTVNALAWNEKDGLIDRVGGVADLHAKILRCVGDPETRFREDALRILRCLRFASTLNFTPEEKTSAAARKLAPTLSKISAERKAEELSRLLCGENAARILLSYPDILGQILPEFPQQIGYDQNTPYHNLTLGEHTVRVLEALPPDTALRLTAWLHDTGKPACRVTTPDGISHYPGHPEAGAKIAERMLRELKFDNATRHTVLTLIRWHDTTIPPEPPAVKRALAALGENLFFRLLLFKRADNLAQAPAFSRKAEYDALEATARGILDRGECYTLRTLAVKGNDLIAAGLCRGKETGTLLSALLNDVIDGKCENTADALMAAAKKHRLSEKD